MGSTLGWCAGGRPPLVQRCWLPATCWLRRHPNPCAAVLPRAALAPSHCPAACGASGPWAAWCVQEVGREWAQRQGLERNPSGPSHPPAFFYGFHSVPSMRQLHLHVISQVRHTISTNRVCSPWLLPVRHAPQQAWPQAAVHGAALCWDLLAPHHSSSFRNRLRVYRPATLLASAFRV